MQKAKREQLSTLMSYDHFMASALQQSQYDTPAGKRVQNEDVVDFSSENEEDPVGKTGGLGVAIENGNSGENLDDGFLVDDVLTSVVKQGDRMVSYIFQKFD